MAAAAGQALVTVNYAAPVATPGAQVTTSPPSGSVFPLGDTSVAVTAAEGTNIATCLFTVTVLPTDDFGRALGATNLLWGSEGDAPWFVETTVPQDGFAAAQSGAVSSGQASTLYTVLLGPGTLSFSWGLADDWPDLSLLDLRVDGLVQKAVSVVGFGWGQQTLEISPGTHLVEWTYTERTGGGSGRNAGWLAQVSYTGQPGPFSLFCPSSIAVMATPGQASASVRYAVPLATPGGGGCHVAGVRFRVSFGGHHRGCHGVRRLQCCQLRIHR